MRTFDEAFRSQVLGVRADPLPGFEIPASIHVEYAEFKDFPAGFGGRGRQIPDSARFARGRTKRRSAVGFMPVKSH